MSYKRSKLFFLFILILFLIVGIGFLFIKPSNTRNWIDEFAVFPQAKIEGSRVTIEGVRDWTYSTEEAVSKNFVNQSFDVDNLERVWFVVEPFSKNDNIAHTFFIFEFVQDKTIGLSIEARREVGEEYSAFKGLFPKYELLYLWGSEADLLTNRAVMKQHPVFVYPLELSPEIEKALFTQLVRETIEFEQNPVWYNTLSNNCTNALARSANKIKPGFISRFHKARYLTGLSDELLYEKKLISNSASFESQQKKANVSLVVQELSGSDEFSKDFHEKLERVWNLE